MSLNNENPSLEIKKIIEQTIKAIIKNGKQFEKKLLKESEQNKRLSFMNKESPYNKYYKFKLEEEINKEKDENLKEIYRSIDIVSDIFKNIYPSIPITESQDTIIKTTAQYACIKGEEFLNQLQKIENNNNDFNFLKPTSKLFPYFMEIMKSYVNIYNPKKELFIKLKSYSDLNNDDSIEKSIIFSRAEYKFGFEKQKEDDLKKKDEIEKRNNEEMKLINWSVFTVVEVIDINNDQFIDNPPEIRSDELNSSLYNKELLYIRNENEGDENKFYINKEEEEVSNDKTYSKDDEEEKKERENKGKEGKPKKEIKIIKDIDMEMLMKKRMLMNNKISKEKYQCPICKVYIEEDFFEDHLKIELLNPKWKEIKDEIKKRKSQLTLNSSIEIANYLKEYEEHREKEEEKEKNKEIIPPQIIYDGYAPNISRITAKNTMIALQNKKQVDQNKRLNNLNIHNEINEYEKKEYESEIKDEKVIFLSNLGVSTINTFNSNANVNKNDDTSKKEEKFEKIEEKENAFSDIIKNNIPVKVDIEFPDKRLISLTINSNILVLDLMKNLIKLNNSSECDLNILKFDIVYFFNNKTIHLDPYQRLFKYDLKDGVKLSICLK